MIDVLENTHIIDWLSSFWVAWLTSKTNWQLSYPHKFLHEILSELCNSLKRHDNTIEGKMTWIVKDLKKPSMTLFNQLVISCHYPTILDSFVLFIYFGNNPQSIPNAKDIFISIFHYLSSPVLQLTLYFPSQASNN